MSTIRVPQKFINAVSLHMMRNLVQIPGYIPPLILGIHGPSGEGKTFQTEIILQEMRVKVFLISGGQFESEKAGEPGRMLRAKYLEASQFMSMNSNRTWGAALLINDFDAGIGDFSNTSTIVQYTVNSQIVNATLMNIADKPDEVGSVKTKRIPIFITGNNFSTLYEPLVRHGRMSKFEWKPAIEDKMQVVRGMYEPDLISDDDIKWLVQNFPSESIDFFTVLKDSMFDDQLLRLISDVGIPRAVEHARAQKYELFLPQYSIEDLIEKGKLIQRSSQMNSHIKPQKGVSKNA
jgi:hypothetical protein